MKIDQLQELKDLTTKDQLIQLLKEGKNNIDEFIRIQRYIEEEMFFSQEIAKTPASKSYRNEYIDLMYKLSTNGYAHIVNLIIDKLRNRDSEAIKQGGSKTVEQACKTEKSIYRTIKKIVDDIDKGIIYSYEFINNLIDCTIEDTEYHLDLFDIYNSASENPILTNMIRELISNKKFVINRGKKIYTFINRLKELASLDNQTTSNNIPNYLEVLFEIIKSDELLDRRNTEEHDYIINFFVHFFDKEQSHKLLELSTSSKVVENRSFEEQLYILSIYNEVLHKEDVHKTLKRLLVDPRIYIELSFDFQMYLIEIMNSIKVTNLHDYLEGRDFIDAIEKAIDCDGNNLEYEIKKLIKKYTNYAKSVEDIIRASSTREEAINSIASEVKCENITEFDNNTKLVYVPSFTTKKHNDIIKGKLNPYYY